MSKKLYALISTLVTCAGTATGAIVGFLQPDNFLAIESAILIAVPAINDILLLFVKSDSSEK